MEYVAFRKRLKVASLTDVDLIDLLESAVRCNHYCPTICNHFQGKFSEFRDQTVEDIKQELLFRLTVRKHGL